MFGRRSASEMQIHVPAPEVRARLREVACRECGLGGTERSSDLRDSGAQGDMAPSMRMTESQLLALSGSICAVEAFDIASIYDMRQRRWRALSLDGQWVPIEKRTILLSFLIASGRWHGTFEDTTEATLGKGSSKVWATLISRGLVPERSAVADETVFSVIIARRRPEESGISRSFGARLRAAMGSDVRLLGLIATLSILIMGATYYSAVIFAQIIDSWRATGLLVFRIAIPFAIATGAIAAVNVVLAYLIGEFGRKTRIRISREYVEAAIWSAGVYRCPISERELIARSKDAGLVAGFLVDYLLPNVAGHMHRIGAIAYIFIQSPNLGFAVSAVMICAGLIQLREFRDIRKIRVALRARRSAFTAHVILRVRNLFAFYQWDRRRVVYDRVQVENGAIMGLACRDVAATARGLTVLACVEVVALAGACWLLVAEAKAGRCSAGDAAAALGAVILAFGGVRAFRDVLSRASLVASSVKRVDQVFHRADMPAAGCSYEAFVGDVQVLMEIEVFKLWVDNSRLLLSDLTIRILRGQWVALGGRNGVGKTTLARALGGAYGRCEGRVRLDPKLFGECTRDNVLDRVVVMEPRTYFPLDVLRNNLASMAGDADQTWVQECLDDTLCREVIDKLPGDLGGLGGLAAPSLSKGEIFRLALACALARKPALIVFDEALDCLSGSHLSHIVLRLRARGIGIVVVSHRREIRQLCDFCIDLPGGERLDMRLNRDR